MGGAGGCSVWAAVVFFSVQLSLVHGQAVLQYSCDLLGYDDAVDTCTDGVLTCGSGRAGTPCQSAAYGASDCPFSLAPNFGCEGNLIRNGAGQPACNNAECVCQEGYKLSPDGRNCEQQRISATCDDAAMRIFMRPYRQQDTGNYASYNIIVSETPAVDFSDTSCTLATGGIDAYTSETFEYTNPTGNCLVIPQDETVGGVASKVLYAYVQHRPQFQHADDQLFKFICSPASNEATVQTHTVVNREKEPELSSSSQLDGVRMDIKIPTDSGFADITDETQLELGDDISLILQYTDVFTLTSCQASGDATFATSIDIIDDVCVPTVTSVLYTDVIAYADTSDPASEGGSSGNHVMRLPLKLFVLPGEDELHLRCTVCRHQDCGTPSVACASNIAAVLQNVADLDSSSRRRRKRRQVSTATTDLAVSIRLSDAALKTGDNGGASRGSDTSLASAQTCYTNLSVLLPMCLLCVLLCVSVVLGGVFLRRVLTLETALKSKH